MDFIALPVRNHEKPDDEITYFDSILALGKCLHYFVPRYNGHLCHIYVETVYFILTKFDIFELTKETDNSSRFKIYIAFHYLNYASPDKVEIIYILGLKV